MCVFFCLVILLHIGTVPSQTWQKLFSQVLISADGLLHYMVFLVENARAQSGLKGFAVAVMRILFEALWRS